LRWPRRGNPKVDCAVSRAADEIDKCPIERIRGGAPGKRVSEKEDGLSSKRRFIEGRGPVAMLIGERCQRMRHQDPLSVGLELLRLIQPDPAPRALRLPMNCCLGVLFREHAGQAQEQLGRDQHD
jgi:hypothetical protein